MSQQGRRKTKRLLDFQARNQYGTTGGRRAFVEVNNFLNYVHQFQNTSNIFFLWRRKFLQGILRPLLVTGLWTSIHQRQQTFSCVLYAYSPIPVQFSKTRSRKPGSAPASPAAHHAQLLVFDEALAQPHFAVVNCSDVGMSVFHSTVLTRSLMFLQLLTVVSQS